MKPAVLCIVFPRRGVAAFARLQLVMLPSLTLLVLPVLPVLVSVC